MTLRPFIRWPSLVLVLTARAADAGQAGTSEPCLSFEGKCQPLHCEAPRIRDVFTLECVEHDACPAGQELVAGTCAAQCSPEVGREPGAGHACTRCPPGQTYFNGDEIAGCAKPGESIMPRCDRPHEHLDASIVPRCKCDPGFVQVGGPTMLSLDCIRPCSGNLGYDPKTSSCRECTSAEDKVSRICLAKCAKGMRRNEATAECECLGGLYKEAKGKCVHCLDDRVWNGVARTCDCPPGTDELSWLGCATVCESGQIHDLASKKCGACDAAGAFPVNLGNSKVCVHCSFDEAANARAQCECRPGYRRANGHCVRD